jgi:polar amino acid transport system permease protein
MRLDFSGTFARADLLLSGALLTVELAAAAMAAGFLIALCAAGLQMSYRGSAGRVVTAYVELIRNTPFLVQIFIIYYGLPSIGLRLSPIIASIIGLSIYVGAYATEILRAGIESIGRGQIEAARALGLRPLGILRHVIVVPALAAIYPALTSQFILLMLATSIVSAISTPELTGAANDIQGMTFRSLEAYLVVAAAYLTISAAFRLVFAGLGRVLFPFQLGRA